MHFSRRDHTGIHHKCFSCIFPGEIAIMIIFLSVAAVIMLLHSFTASESSQNGDEIQLNNRHYRPRKGHGHVRRINRPKSIPRRFLAEQVPTLASLPPNFNWAERRLLTSHWNQHLITYCGSCWAHSSLASVQDRINIMKGGKGVPIRLSRQTLLNCAADIGFGNGCDGGEVADAFQYLAEVGLPTESCQAYTATSPPGLCSSMGVCQNCMSKYMSNETACWPVHDFTRYYVKGFNKIASPNNSSSRVELSRAVASELMARGPVVCGCASTDAFEYNYTGGVWENSEGEVDHDVELVGFGETFVDENGEEILYPVFNVHRKVQYWLVRNSWGDFWGENGFFRAPRGTNNSIIQEDDCWFALPDLRDEEKLQFKVGSMHGLVDNPQLQVSSSKLL